MRCVRWLRWLAWPCGDTATDSTWRTSGSPASAFLPWRWCFGSYRGAGWVTRIRRRCSVADTPLGLPAGTVQVVPYDPRWPELFTREQIRLRSILASRDLALQYP